MQLLHEGNTYGRNALGWNVVDVLQIVYSPYVRKTLFSVQNVNQIGYVSTFLLKRDNYTFLVGCKH